MRCEFSDLVYLSCCHLIICSTLSADEAYVDAGASCYNPLEGKKEKVDVTVSGDTVELKTPGTYTVKYSCKNSDGLKASPKSRTVVIDPKYAEDWWEGEANIQIGGYTAKTFGALERKEFVKSLATSLDIPVSVTYESTHITFAYFIRTDCVAYVGIGWHQKGECSIESKDVRRRCF